MHWHLSLYAMKTRKEFTPGKEAREAQPPERNPETGRDISPTEAELDSIASCRPVFPINKPGHMDRIDYAPAIASLLLTFGTVCSPSGHTGKNIPTLTANSQADLHSCRTQSNAISLRLKSHMLCSGKATRPGMLGEPLLGHLACHLPTGPESCCTIPQLIVNVPDTLQGAGESQGWDPRHRGRRERG